MDSSDLIVLTPAGAPDPALAVAAVRAGARGTLDLEYASPSHPPGRSSGWPGSAAARSA